MAILDLNTQAPESRSFFISPFPLSSEEHKMDA